MRFPAGNVKAPGSIGFIGMDFVNCADAMHRIRLLLVLALTALFTPYGRSQSFTYTLTGECRKAYDYIFELRFDEAQRILDAEMARQPENLMPVFLENYIDFLALFIAEEDALWAEREANKSTRLNLIRKGDKDSPYYLYTQAEIHMQWAFSRIKYGEYVKAFLEVRKAYKMLQDNAARFPGFKPNLKSLGILHTLLGAIPDKYKLGAKVLGMEGSIPQGLSELATVLEDKNFVFREEALIMYALLQLHLNKNETEAWKVISNQGLRPESNLLHCFAASSVAMYTGRNDDMIRLLENRPKGPQYFPFPYLDFYLGLAKLHRLDADADVYFKKYLEAYKGKNYIKEAYRKLAWHALIHGNKGRYNYYLQMCLLDGQAVSDEDKSALAEAKSGRTPHLGLLKARLLFDGAYYDKALVEIGRINASNLLDDWHRIEYYYRKGRIMDELGRADEARQAYEYTIEHGGHLPTFFSANACIKLGLLYERQGRKELAAEYYNKALTFRDHEYLNSIEAEARAGLNRIK